MGEENRGEKKKMENFLHKEIAEPRKKIIIIIVTQEKIQWMANTLWIK